MTILQGTMQDGSVIPVQVDAQGRLVAEGLQGAPGPAGPAGQTTQIGGTVTAPTLSATGDPDTGIYSPAANQLGFATAGVGRLVIGDVGTSQVTMMTGTQTIDIANSTTGIRFKNGTGSTFTIGQTNGITSPDAVINQRGNAPLYFMTNNQLRLTLDARGRMLVGANSLATSDAKLQVDGSIRLKNFANKAELDGLVPAPVAGGLAVVASKLYFRDATAWREVALGADLA